MREDAKVLVREAGPAAVERSVTRFFAVVVVAAGLLGFAAGLLAAIHHGAPEPTRQVVIVREQAPVIVCPDRAGSDRAAKLYLIDQHELGDAVDTAPATQTHGAEAVEAR